MALTTLSEAPVAQAAGRAFAARLGAHAVRLPWLAIGAGTALFVCVAPTAMVLWASFAGGAPRADAASLRLAAESVFGLTALLLLGGAGALIIGVVAAWLAAMCAFPGRRLFEWALALPLAAPAYILAYAYGGLTGPTGLAPIGLSGIGGAAFVYTLALYPYVYLGARAAFATQSVCALEAARSLGATPAQAFFRVALPMARGGVIAGLALALMEIAADYGAAAYFGVRTLTTGIFHAWFSRGEPQLALQMASLLIVAAMGLLWLERTARARTAAQGISTRWRPLPRYRLGAWSGALAAGFCTLVLTLAVIAPMGWLVRLAVQAPAPSADLSQALANSLVLAGAGTAAALTCAGLIAAAGRAGVKFASLAGLAASAGYAAPGAAMALGGLFGFAALRELGLAAGLTGALSLGGLIWIYAARFAAAGVQPIEAGLERVTASLAGAARTLGAGPLRRFWRIDAPIAAPAAAAAALILFVEILRELPATVLLRPFDFDTLAVLAHAYASDDRLAQAARPALLIVAAGLAPILLVSRAMLKARAGARA
jgi:iron(III) transport system permease protein